MTTGTDYGKLYNQAYAKYGQGDYEAALSLTQQMEQEFPNDPHLYLLQGNIYYGLGQYDHACNKYESVLAMQDQLGDQPQVLEYAHQGLERAQQYLAQLMDPELALAETESISMTSQSPQMEARVKEEEDFMDWQEEANSFVQTDDFAVDGVDWDSAIFSDEEFGEPTLGKSALSAGNPFDTNPEEFAQEEDGIDFSLADADFDNVGDDEFSFEDEDHTDYPTPSSSDPDENTFMVPRTLNDSSPSLGRSTPLAQSNFGESDWSDVSMTDERTIQVSPMNYHEQEEEDEEWDGLGDQDLEGLSQFNLTDISEELPDSGLFSEDMNRLASNFALDEVRFATHTSPDGDDHWLKSEKSSGMENSSVSGQLVKPAVEVDQGKLGWLINAPLAKKQLITAAAAGLVSTFTVLFVAGGAALMSPQDKTPTPNPSPTPTGQKQEPNQPNAQENSAQKEQTPPKKTKEKKQGSPIFLIALLSGLSTFAVTFVVLEIIKRYAKRTIDDLGTQLDALYQGNYNVKATIFGEDELGGLSSRFNAVAREVHTKTSEALARATEVEQAREDLQRQVIRLLDDVEGAARGDLTVEAEVTADVLGAVADAFNLTIQNLREIVKQVKKAAKQVNKGSTDSESFARNNSGDALRMAEELAVTLNSVQMMTESIQRVAENAREAEKVAHTSSITALKGGETVEQTVAAILQIRETVSEAARKVKRLAEASQEISKIVAVISQIASRTNLLALNASIQAARAGEAGKGFAIVADEVRQLADRSAKELKDIEQIVLQIQSETGSVMKAMEEGIQQVIKLTDMSEQSKRALEDIIEVSNRINTLVRSITADTVKQRENSRAVAQVMQSVELTAQETSQESQRVAGSLQKLVSISCDLLSSVESFQVDAQ